MLRKSISTAFGLVAKQATGAATSNALILQQSAGSTVIQAAKLSASASGGGGILGFAKSHPFAFQVAVSTVKTSIADIMTQMAIEGKSFDQIDWARNGVFIIFGAAYLGCFQWYLQVTKFRKWFPGMDRFANATFAEKLKDGPGMASAAKQVAFDLLIHLPLMYFPAFYTVKELVQGNSYNPVDWVVNGCTKYYNNMTTDLTKLWALWGPADIILFSVPMYLRMPLRHIVSLGWTSYLSFLRGSAH